MNFIGRAWLYMIRKKGKSILLFVVLLIMATFVLTALALGNASDAAQQNLRKSLGGSFNIHFDYSDNNPYLKVEETESGIIAYCTQQIEPELVEKIRAIDGVKSCSAQVGSVVDCPELELFEGTLPVDKELKNSTNIVGVWKGEEYSRFTSGEIVLTQGRYITPQDERKIIISEDLAKQNGLKIGDTIRTSKNLELEIVGLFTPRELEDPNDRVMTFDKIQNLIISDLASVVAYENSPSVQGFNELNVSVEDPQDMESIIAKVKEMKDVDWKGFEITLNNESFENAASSLQQLSSLMSTILIVVLVVSVAVLSLILTMWARTRIHETGVLLSVGIRKLSILGQYIAEVLMIAILAFSLSYFSSSAIAGQMGNMLQAEQSVSEVQEDDGLSGNRGEAQNSNPDTVVESPELQVSIQLEELGLLFVIGIGIVTVSAGIASISVMRLKPREILSKMS